MRIWTTHSLPFWNRLQEQGVVRCDTDLSCWASDFKEAYDWMADQMTRRIGPAPFPEVQYPIWGWRQVGSYKKEYHGSLTDCGGEEDEFVFITADIPDHLVLLSDFDLWHCVLNHSYADYIKHRHEPDEEAAIVKSWENIFNLDQRGHSIRHRRNRSIQATFWELRAEWVTGTTRIKGFQRWKQQDLEKWGARE